VILLKQYIPKYKRSECLRTAVSQQTIIHFSMELGLRIITYGQDLSYIKELCHSCDVIGLNVHAPNKNKTNVTKDIFYEELECVLGKLPKYHIEIFT
jgi:hypothetical protein